MKIIFDTKLKNLAQKLGEKFGFICMDSGSWPGMTRNDGNENILFVGRGLANKVLKIRKEYPKCWEVGSITDNIDYLHRIIFNKNTLEEDKTVNIHRKSPEKIIAQKFDYDCGWGMFCTVMLIINREDVLKTDVYGRLGVNSVEGTKSENVKKLLEEEKIPYLEIWKADLSDVENVLRNDGVIMVSYQSEGTAEEVESLECGHYSVIFDIDDQDVWLIDPSEDVEYTPGYGKGVVRRPRQEFEKLWIDKGVNGELYDHWMLAIKTPTH